MQVVQKIQETFNISVPARVITGLNRFVGLPNGIIEGNTNIRDFIGVIEVSTVNGDIDITLPKETKADTMARTMEGDVYTGFDTDLIFGGEMGNRKGGSLQSFMNPYFNSNNINARINGGGNKVYLNTINGNIYIRKGE